MRPVRTARSNFVWTGPTPDVGDLHAEITRSPGEMDHRMTRTRSVWEPSPEDRAAIAAGANIALDVWGMHPPVEVSVTEERGVGEDAPELRERLREFASKP